MTVRQTARTRQSPIETHRLRVAAKPLGIVKIDAHGEAATLQFEPQPPIDAMRIIELVQKNRHIKLNGQDKLRITANMPDLAARVAQIKTTLKAATLSAQHNMTIQNLVCKTPRAH